MSAVTYATAQLLRVLPRARLSRAVGRLADLPWSPGLGRAVVSLYSHMYDVSFAECADAGPWPNFDAFFTRRLRDGVRPIDVDPRAVLSPADGRLAALSRIEPGGRFVVKGRPYSVEELVGDAAEARRFERGAGFVVYLSPRDYHRVHAPVRGTVSRIVSMPGDYYPVNDIGLEHVPNLFCRNRRVAIEIDSDEGLGKVTVVMVAAIIVGRITVTGIEARDVPLGVHAPSPPVHVTRGDEIGVFHLGSTAVVLLEERAAGAWLAGEGTIRFGQPVARAQAVGARAGAQYASGPRGSNGSAR